LLVLLTLVGVGLGAYVFRREERRQDFKVTPDDILWANDQYLLKMDMRNAGRFYGVSLVVFDERGTRKRRLATFCAEKPTDYTEVPVVMLAMRERNGEITGRLRYLGQTTDFETTVVWQGSTRGWTSQPKRDGDYYYFMSDSAIGGSYPEDSNRMAIEVLRAPLP
jgi:hypothetical protein